MADARLYKIKMRAGRALVSATNDGTEAPQAGPGDELVVSEEVAAFLARHRSAEIIELVEPYDDGPRAA